MKGLHEGENIWEHLPGTDSNFDIADITRRYNAERLYKMISIKWLGVISSDEIHPFQATERNKPNSGGKFSVCYQRRVSA